METNSETRMAVVIEDEDDIRHLLETVLTQAGFMVVATSNGLDGLAAVRKHDPIVTTLDVNMPGMDGFETARRIREFSSTYIVMLTALNEEIDTLQGLEAGADDYVNKPFRPRELRARIEAMLRRPRTPLSSEVAAAPPAPAPAPVTVQSPAPAVAPTSPPTWVEPVAQPSFVEPAAPPAYVDPAIAHQTANPAYTPPAYTPPAYSPPVYSAPNAPAASAPTAPESTAAQAAGVSASETGPDWIAHNGLRLNAEARVVKVDNVEVELTRSEFDLLVAILDSHRRVKSKADLVLLLRGESYVTSHFVSDADKRAIEVHMANLRKKLGDNLATPRWIETVRGVGYRLTAADS